MRLSTKLTLFLTILRQKLIQPRFIAGFEDDGVCNARLHCDRYHVHDQGTGGREYVQGQLILLKEFENGDWMRHSLRSVRSILGVVLRSRSAEGGE